MWFDVALAELDALHPRVAAAVRARALADRTMLAIETTLLQNG